MPISERGIYHHPIVRLLIFVAARKIRRIDRQTPEELLVMLK